VYEAARSYASNGTIGMDNSKMVTLDIIESY